MTDEYAARETWLRKLGEAFAPHIEAAASEVTGESVAFGKWRVSCGWPKSGRGAIGECWHGECSGDAAREIFISPELGTPEEVGHVLAHEMVHAILPEGVGHKKPFPAIVKALGLEGKPTSTVSGPGFEVWAAPLMSALGDYPHAAMTAPTRAGTKKTYLIKATAPCCGNVLRLTQKVIDASGLPYCGCSGEFVQYTADMPEEGEE